MRYPETEIKTKDGRTAILRNTRVDVGNKSLSEAYASLWDSNRSL